MAHITLSTDSIIEVVETINVVKIRIFQSETGFIELTQIVEMFNGWCKPPVIKYNTTNLNINHIVGYS